MNDRGDGFTKQGAERLARMMQNYWQARGYHGFKVDIIHAKTEVYDKGECGVYSVRSNIGPTGFPPRQKEGMAV